MNYRGLNLMTIKNQYFFSLINKILDHLSDAQVLTKINVKNTYYYL